MTLTVREMTAAETDLIIDYFQNSTPEHLETLGVDAHDRLSFLPRSDEDADARRRSMRAGPTPLSSMILSRAPCPETMVTALSAAQARPP